MRCMFVNICSSFIVQLPAESKPYFKFNVKANDVMFCMQYISAEARQYLPLSTVMTQASDWGQLWQDHAICVLASCRNRADWPRNFRVEETSIHCRQGQGCYTTNMLNIVGKVFLWGDHFESLVVKNWSLQHFWWILRHFLNCMSR